MPSGRKKRRIVVCCDGTWNRPDQLVDGRPAPTNVTKLSLGVDHGEDAGQRLLYQRGVGTGRFERIRGGAMGFGLSRHVRDCYRFLIREFEPGDEIFLFGYSRGAFTARSTAGLVRNCGILRPEHEDKLGDAYRLYRSRRPECHPRGREAELFRDSYAHEDVSKITFIGVWDTVGALGIPIRFPLLAPLVKLFNRRYEFHDTDLSRHVANAFQALAIDERRAPFRPALWSEQAGGEQTVEQVWFPGSHSDVGGGNPEPGISEIPLLWLARKARECGLRIGDDHLRISEPPLDPDRRASGSVVAPDPLAPLHDSMSLLWRLAGSHERIIGTDAGQLLAATVVDRRDVLGYDPAGVARFLAAGGQTTPVL